MIITHNGTILKHEGTILTKITEVPPQPPFTNTYSLDFDGVDDYVSTNSKIIGSNITLSGWVNFNGGSYTSFVSQFPMSITPSNTNAPNETIGRFYKSGRGMEITIQCYDQTGGNFSTYSVRSFDFEGAGWQHVCWTYNVTTKHIYVYVNGFAQTWTNFGGTITTPYLTAVSSRVYERDLTIGRVKPASSTGTYLGLVDEVSTYNRILTQEEITSISSAPTDLTSLSPTAWYRMGDNGAYKSPQWLIPSNENKDKVSNYSLELDGIDDYIDLGNDSSLDIFGSDFTISLWAKWGAQTTNSNGLVNFASNTNKAVITLGFSTQYGKISFGTGSSSIVGILYDCGSGYDDGDWHHIMCTLEGSTRTIYVDGVDISSSGSVSSIGVGSNNDIGNRARSRYFVGNIDEVSIFDSVIPIGDIWNGSGQPTTISGAVAHWRMGEEATFSGGVWTVPDQVGSNDGTSNAMTIEDRVGEAPNSE